MIVDNINIISLGDEKEGEGWKDRGGGGRGPGRGGLFLREINKVVIVWGVPSGGCDDFFRIQEGHTSGLEEGCKIVQVYFRRDGWIERDSTPFKRCETTIIFNEVMKKKRKAKYQ
jgi:hypothetical protein